MAERADEKLISAMLRIMGYELGGDGIWRNEATGNRWFAGGCYALNHGFAAKVKGWMMREWDCDDDSFSHSGPDGPTECEGYVSFHKTLYHKDDDNYSYEIEGAAGYTNMDDHPRAVLEAAIAAVKAEKAA